MARRDEFEISRSSTLRSRRAVVAASEAGGGAALVGERVGLVMGESSKGSSMVVGSGSVGVG